MTQYTAASLVIISAMSGASLCGAPPSPGTLRAPVSYVLGPDDQISIRVLDVDEISPQPVRVDAQGNITVPLAGRLTVAGATVEQLEAEITKRLKNYLLNPTVSITITEFRSQPISILGAVNRPGVHQLQGHKNLFEALALAEGLRPDSGGEIVITRRKEWGPIPLAGAVDEEDGAFSVARVSVKSVMDGKHPNENIDMRPNDVISVPKAEMIYVVGSVRRPGGFVLSEKKALSVLQALSLAEGLDRTASAKNATILRAIPGSTQHSELPVNVQKILTGKSNDMALQANDVLFIPNNTAKSVALRSVDALVQTGSGVIIYRR
jgi:polysaccharide export outer membrane protein